MNSSQKVAGVVMICALATGVLLAQNTVPATTLNSTTNSQLLATVHVGSSPGIAVPPTFMGLSHEWHDSEHFMGKSSTGANLIYRQLITNLTGYGSGPIFLRIGGDSTDNTKMPDSDIIDPFAEVAKTVKARFSLGVNLGSNNVDLAVNQAKYFVSHMPPGSLEAIEIGNEPDLFHKNHKRSPQYSAEDYFADFDKWQKAITPVLPAGLKLMGPSWCAAYWNAKQENVQTFLDRESPYISIFSNHDYVTNPGAHPTADTLLEPKYVQSTPALLPATIAAVHAKGLPLRINEFNSVGNEGVHGVGDSFAAALWSIDLMFEFVKIGVDGVNWEASGGNYDQPFFFHINHANGKDTFSIDTVTPLYYGMLFFQAATGHQARLLPVDLNTDANLKAWATIDSKATRRLVLVNKETTRGGVVSVSMPGFHHATVSRLLAPSQKSLTGVTFAGYTFDNTPDGKMKPVTNAPRVEKITAIDGHFQIPISTTSAALILFAK